MNMKQIGIGVILALCGYGCGGPGTGAQGDVDHWLSKVPAGTSADRANGNLADNDFQPWSTGRVIYGYRDKVYSADYSNGVSVQLHEDPDGKVASAEAFSSPVEPYPMLMPVYPR